MLKQAVQNCDLIFDGKSESPEKAFRGSNNMIYTPYRVTVNKVIFGKFSKTKILILVEGGQIEENGMGYGTSTPHGINFLKDINSIVFCTKSETTNFPDSYVVKEQVCYKTNNDVIITNYLSEHFRNITDFLNQINQVIEILNKN